MTPRWTPRALRDVAAVIERIAADDPAAAERMLARILAVVDDTLTAQPLIGRPGRVAQTREFTVHASYILVYRIQPGAVELLAFRHTARLWPDRF